MVALGFAAGLPNLLIFDTLFVANHTANTIQRFTPAGVGSVVASAGLNGPLGLVVRKELR